MAHWGDEGALKHEDSRTQTKKSIEEKYWGRGLINDMKG